MVPPRSVPSSGLRPPSPPRGEGEAAPSRQADATLAHLLAFPPILRAHAFPASPDRTAAFVAGVHALGPRSVRDIRAAALATFGIAPERQAEFDALFDAHFRGRTLAAPSGTPDEDDEVRVAEDRPGKPPEIEGEREGAAEATAAERLGARELSAMARLRRPGALPVRASRRRRPSRLGAPDLRRAAREVMRTDGDVLALPRRRRRERPRRVLLLMDVSGSMSDLTGETMRVAHALVRRGRDVEAFTLGTRLTRVTRALRLPVETRALAEASALVADWDGGTRLGDALAAFLAVPRFAGHARGALVVVVSDGLERGDPAAMAGAVERLSRLAWRLVWLTPLGGGVGWAPPTEALALAARHVDRFGRAGAAEVTAGEILAEAA